MASKLSYRFTPRASEDLLSILGYIKNELSNPKAASDLALKIFNGIDQVRQYPDSGIKVDNPHITDKSVRKFYADNYIVFYKTDKEAKSLIIVRIVYGKRNLCEILKGI